ncbi:hypothetical protein NC653_003632 [Populus alba x Populus x berolinensis]|uniref:Uncharacterized protein n=2 Tax=Populus alba x Populus x berolinensis TaxID=444605 RepID=A0AAD6RST6_9ROSI|nr:hypothetical protein NC653_003632 [Populus alba x Populus x berolinensis]
MASIDITKEEIYLMENNNSNIDKFDISLIMNIDLKRQIYSLKEVSKLFICNENLVKKNEILKAQVIDLNFT